MVPDIERSFLLAGCHHRHGAKLNAVQASKGNSKLVGDVDFTHDRPAPRRR
jgi:hypothetical protein